MKNPKNWELSCFTPARLHRTVPLAFRRNSQIQKVLALHRALPKASEIETLRGYRATRPLATILALAREGSISQDLIEQALTEGHRRGVILPNELTQAKADAPLPPWFSALLRRRSA